MASKPETTFYESVHRHLPPSSELYRMKNNNEYIAGVPDFWYSGKRDLWVEWKFIVLPKRDDTLIDLVDGKKPSISYLQQKWLEDRYREGRNVWVIVGCKEGGLILDSPEEWQWCRSTENFRNLISTRQQIAAQIVDFVKGRS